MLFPEIARIVKSQTGMNILILAIPFGPQKNKLFETEIGLIIV